MPTVLRVGKYRFFFYSNEGNEPPHVHIEAGGKLGKVWLNPVAFAHQGGYNDREMRKILEIISAHRDQLEEAWHDYFH